MMFILYERTVGFALRPALAGEVIITTLDNEAETVSFWFTSGKRDLGQFQRKVIDAPNLYVEGDYTSIDGFAINQSS